LNLWHANMRTPQPRRSATAYRHASMLATDRSNSLPGLLLSK